MMKLVISLLLCLAVCSVKSQTTTDKLNTGMPVVSNTDRFLIDYGIQDWGTQLKDSTKLRQLDLEYYDKKRKQNEDQIFYDEKTGLNIVLYSCKKASENKGKY